MQLNQNGITSDWYAYLSGIRQFANPEATDINVFATPGIDYVNQKLLVQEAIEMIEEERADSIYVITTPDKPSGAGDYVDEMYGKYCHGSGQSVFITPTMYKINNLGVPVWHSELRIWCCQCSSWGLCFA